jgi:hypothetical protein
VFGAIGTIPDFDILWGRHSAETHSMVAALAVGLVAFAGVASRTRVWTAVTVALAYGTHLALDWLGNDGTQPFGVMAFWPFDNRYYESDLHLFMAISRRYWLAGFWDHNLRAIASELVLLGPPFFIAWIAARTVATMRTGSGERTSPPI